MARLVPTSPARVIVDKSISDVVYPIIAAALRPRRRPS